LKEFWKFNNIWNGLNNDGDPWTEIKETTTNGFWTQFRPVMVTNFEVFEESPKASINKHVQFLNQLGFEISTKDVGELTASHSEPMSNEA
jgi:hypothetical protein